MICIPIMGRTQAAALKAIEKSAPHADMIELRMDLIPSGNLKELIEKSRSCAPPLKIIVTNRNARQGGMTLPERGSHATRSIGSRGEGEIPDDDAEKRRIALLKEAVVIGCDYVDCELDTAEVLRHELISQIKSHNHRTKLIVSHHDFKATPSMNVLKKLFHACEQAGAAVAKIVAYAQRPEDNLRILNLVAYARKEGRVIVAFCMGEHGTASRIMAPLLGSFITFAALRSGAESAPGQLTVKEIKEILRILGIKQ